MTEIDHKKVASMDTDGSNNLWENSEDTIHQSEESDVIRSQFVSSTVLSGNTLIESDLNTTDRTDAIISLFVDRVGKLPNVSAIYEYREPNQMQIECWVIIEEDDFELRNQIYSVEYDLLGMFEEGDIDSHVIYSGDDPTESRVPEKAWKVPDLDDRVVSYATSV